MELLDRLFSAAHCAVVRIDFNTTPLWYRDKLENSNRSVLKADLRPMVVLLSAKFERTSFELIDDSPVIFFDEPSDPRDDEIDTLLQRWAVPEATLLTLSFEESLSQQSEENMASQEDTPRQSQDSPSPRETQNFMFSKEFAAPSQPIGKGLGPFGQETQDQEVICLNALDDAENYRTNFENEGNSTQNKKGVTKLWPIFLPPPVKKAVKSKDAEEEPFRF